MHLVDITQLRDNQESSEFPEATEVISEIFAASWISRFVTATAAVNDQVSVPLIESNGEVRTSEISIDKTLPLNAYYPVARSNILRTVMSDIVKNSGLRVPRDTSLVPGGILTDSIVTEIRKSLAWIYSRSMGEDRSDYFIYTSPFIAGYIARHRDFESSPPFDYSHNGIEIFGRILGVRPITVYMDLLFPKEKLIVGANTPRNSSYRFFPWYIDVRGRLVHGRQMCRKNSFVTIQFKNLVTNE